jgi:hypothetical protein
VGILDSVSDPDSWSPDPNPAFKAEKVPILILNGSGSMVLMTKNLKKNLQLKINVYIKN